MRKRTKLFTSTPLSVPQEKNLSEDANVALKKWNILKRHLDDDYQHIRFMLNMPLSKWLQWNDDDPIFRYMHSKACQPRIKYREEDEHVLEVIRVQSNCPLNFDDIQLTEELKQNVECVFLNPCEYMKNSHLIRYISPPFIFPKDRLGKAKTVNNSNSLIHQFRKS